MTETQVGAQALRKRQTDIRQANGSGVGQADLRIAGQPDPGGVGLGLTLLALGSNGVYFLGFEPVGLAAATIAVAAAILVAVRVARVSGDVANPLTLILVACLVRYGTPLALLWLWQPPEGLAVLVQEALWADGFKLAAIGMMGLIVGWAACPVFGQLALNRVAIGLAQRFRTTQRTGNAAALLLGMGLGVFALFMVLNYQDPIEAIRSGIVRLAESRVPETSRYAFLAQQLTVAGASVWIGYLAAVRSVRWWVALLPGVIAAMSLIPFGGRIAAATPVVIGLLLLWYRCVPLPRVGSLRLLALAVAITVAVFFYSAFVNGYRKGGGIEHGLEAVSATEISRYLPTFAWYDVGLLEPAALAIYFGPESLGTETTLPLSGGYLGDLLELNVVRPGEFMAKELVGVSPKTWGIHTGLIVDLYLVWGLDGLVIGCVIVGALLRGLYAFLLASPRAVTVLVIYVVSVMNLALVFFESVAGALEVIVLPLIVTMIPLIAGSPRPTLGSCFRVSPVHLSGRTGRGDPN